MAEVVPTWVDGVGGLTPLTAANLNQGSVAIRDLDARTTSLETRLELVSTVVSSGTAVTIVDVGAATLDDVTLTANCTFTFPTASTGKAFTLVLRQDATGGRIVTWPTVRWPGAVAPALTTVASAVDVLSFLSVASAWYGFISGKDMR